MCLSEMTQPMPSLCPQPHRPAVQGAPGLRWPWTYLVTCEAPLPCGPGRGQEHIQVRYGGQSWLYHGHQQLLRDAGFLWRQAGHLDPLLFLILCHKLNLQQHLLSLPGLGMFWPPVLLHTPASQPLPGSGHGSHAAPPAQACPCKHFPILSLAQP